MTESHDSNDKRDTWSVDRKVGLAAIVAVVLLVGQILRYVSDMESQLNSFKDYKDAQVARDLRQEKRDHEQDQMIKDIRREITEGFRESRDEIRSIRELLIRREGVNGNEQRRAR